MADTLEQLDADTETLLSKSLCDFSILRYQQEDGFNTALPYGLRSIDVTRTLTTEAAASLMPFRVQEIPGRGGIYCGVNAPSAKKSSDLQPQRSPQSPRLHPGRLRLRQVLHHEGFITFIALSAMMILSRIIDAESRVWGPGEGPSGGSSGISPNSPTTSILWKSPEAGDGKPVALKSELLMSICEQQMGEGQLGAFHKSIIDRCTASAYHDFIKSGGKARQPHPLRLEEQIKRQPGPGPGAGPGLRLFVEGSLNMFAHETNVDMGSRIIVFDLYEMGTS